jgi:LPXTG-site transpeptidase (sortase) family protein
MPTKKTYITQFQILAILLTLIAISSLIILYIFSRQIITPENTKPIIPTVSVPTTENIGDPKHIKIPDIAVDATIKHVALATDGSMAVPEDPQDTGWYEFGPRPGEIGSAVIDGHVDWYNGARGVFQDLHKIKPGDKIFIIDENNTTLSFVARESKIYNSTADATDIFTSKDNQSHLNLITCIGTWDNNIQQYTERLVIFADREQ